MKPQNLDPAFYATSSDFKFPTPKQLEKEAQPPVQEIAIPGPEALKFLTRLNRRGYDFHVRAYMSAPVHNGEQLTDLVRFAQGYIEVEPAHAMEFVRNKFTKPGDNVCVRMTLTQSSVFIG